MRSTTRTSTASVTSPAGGSRAGAGAEVDVERVVARACRDRYRARDRLPARPARHARRSCAAGGGGRRAGSCIDSDAHSTRRSRMPSTASRSGAAGLADEEAGAEHAVLARDREACRDEHVPRGRSGCARLGRLRISNGSRELSRCSRRCEPGEIRAALPAAPPETAEPFAAVLRDLDAVLMPGITHWQSPRFFAYFATTAPSRASSPSSSSPVSIRSGSSGARRRRCRSSRR